jgi:hypothetical protein
MTWLFLLFLRFYPEVINATRDGDFMESFTLLDGDRILFRSSTKDLFVAIQGHTIMGELYSTNGSNEADRIRHKPGDHFRVQGEDLVLTYRQRGGAGIDTWQIPSGLCSNHNIFSAQQREAIIQIDKTFSEPTTICWFLSFRKSVAFSVDFHIGTPDSYLQIGDTDNLRPDSTLLIVSPTTRRTGTLGTHQLIILKAQPGQINLSVRVSTSLPFADWTDSASLFVDRHQTVTDDLPLYIETIRSVKLWVWFVLFGTGLFVLCLTTAALFWRPGRKPGLTTEASEKEKED